MLCGETELSADELQLRADELQLRADELQLRETAQQCSETALRRHALSSAELAEKVAEAAFDKCKEPWIRFAEALGRRIEASAVRRKRVSSFKCSRGSASFYAFDSERQRFVHDASTEVFDIPRWQGLRMSDVYDQKAACF
jgi:hypothetical protein